jgi:nitrite reductase (NADH) small subunit
MTTITSEIRLSTEWVEVCRVGDLEPGWAEAALLAGEQIALVPVSSSEIYAVSNQDPATGACVMARGIIGSKGGTPTLTSPLHKQVYDLQTGRCFSDPGLRLAVFAVRLTDGVVAVEVPPALEQAA